MIGGVPEECPTRACDNHTALSLVDSPNKLAQRRPQTVSKRFVWTNVNQNGFLGTPYVSPENLFGHTPL